MIKHISLGTSEVFYYDYDGERLPLRPISSYELDECFYRTLIFADEDIAELVVKIKLSLVSVKDEIEYDNKKLARLQRYFDNLDYWVVFYGMKDFQEEEFSKPDKSGLPKGFEYIKKMKDVHLIAIEILNHSYRPEEVIKEFIRSEDGKKLGTVVFRLNVPLADLSNMTKLQRDFLVLSKLESTRGPPRNISFTGDKMKLADLLRSVI